MKKIILYIFIIANGISCNHGLEPYKEPAGFGGTISFQHWPQPDTLITLHLLASQTPPPFGTLDSILHLYALQKLYFIPPDISTSFPKDTSQISYEFFLPQGTYYYIAVVAQITPNYTTDDFKVVGLLTENTITFEPKKLIVPLNTFILNQNINVDFENIPPQPFGKMKKR
jgi:hypothetical protein